MLRRVLARDRKTGKLVLFHALPDGRFVVETQYQLDDVIATAAAIRAEQPTGWHGREHLVAQIPMPLHTQLRKEGIVQDQKAFAAWLNDPDHRKLRAKLGRV
jgi:hypothetical protein